DSFQRIRSGPDTIVPVSDVIVTANDDIYVATDGGGIKYVDRAAGELIDLNIPTPTFSFSKSKMHAMFEDGDGNIWMGVYQKGVFVLPAHRHRFGYIGYKSVSRNLIGSNCVM